jgi:nucleotide-binding universal stress UspA family protein/hemerythrin-like domain-containing protein
MYRHLLVPIDDTPLSVEVIGNAVGLARSVGARITFFHVVGDASGSLLGDAELVRIVAPEDHDYLVVGRARELLAKAEAAARACEVPCESMHRAGEKPAAAIVEAARAKGCDLIFMASHGRRSKLGMALASETVEVLMHAGLPVLVAATGDLRPPARAIAVIRDEHRSLAAVLHAWRHALAVARAGGGQPDAEMMRSVIRYLERFSATVHHPKEQAHLFTRLRERTTTVHAELDELERQHVRDRELVAGLAQQVERLLAAGDAAAREAEARRLEEAAAHYAAFTWEHLGREEGVILPAAQRFLTESDWAGIDEVFAREDDAQGAVETARDRRRLFSRIVDVELS